MMIEDRTAGEVGVSSGAGEQVKLRLKPETLLRLDAARGTLSRQQAFARALEVWLRLPPEER